MTLFEHKLEAALDTLAEMGPFSFRRAGSGVPAKQAQAAPKPDAPAKVDPSVFTKAPYFVEPHELQTLLRDPDDQDAFDSISQRRGRHTAIAVRNAIKGMAQPEQPSRTYETGGWGNWS